MYKRILVVVGDDATSAQATSTSIEMAKAHGTDILFFYVLPCYVITVGGEERMALATLTKSDFERQAASFAKRKLASASALAEQEGVFSLRATGQDSDAAKCVAEAAISRHCQLIVVATERRNAVMRMIFGSIVPRLLTLATVPVLVFSTPADTPHGARKVADAKRKGVVRRHS